MNKLKRIIIHWTAGTYKPNSLEKEHYHFLVEYSKNPMGVDEIFIQQPKSTEPRDPI